LTSRSKQKRRPRKTLNSKSLIVIRINIHYDKKEIKKYSTWYMPEINKPTIKNIINIAGIRVIKIPRITRINDAR